jgi:16S rRNA (adenine1518-N6/adenine1519-N6)-dimethyltransferase
MRAKKRFGQNFLKNPNIVQEMIQSVLESKPESLLEIGPGRGALTSSFLDAGVHTTAIEIDRDLIAYLTKKFQNKSWDLIAQDVLTVDLKQLNHAKKLDVIVGNLPYNISTPFLIKYRDEIPTVPGLFLVQKEVALRLSADPGSKDYGRLSVMMQQSFDIKMLFHVAPENFDPQPQVQSTFIRCTPHDRHLILPELFEPIVRESFCHRRKMLKKSLSTFNIDFLKANVDPTRRPETLSIKEFIELANHSVRQDNLDA